MKQVLAVFFIALFLAGCASKTTIIDNGQPGQIKVIVFYDENENGSQETGEPGLQDRIILSQDISCPPTREDKMTRTETDGNGEALFQDLEPGRYCVSYSGDRRIGTKITVEVDLSSEQEIPVYFGLSEE
jgi:hypothetical protein